MNKILYEEILQSVGDWVWAVDAAGTYTYCSENVYDYLGFRADEVVGKTPFDFMSETEAMRVSELFSKYASKNEKILQLENIHLHKNGKKVIVETTGIAIFDDNGNLLGYQGFDRDITKQKELAQDIQKQNNAFEILFEQSPDGVLIIQNNHFVQCNQGIVKMLGYSSKKEVLNLHPSKLSPEFQPDGRDSFTKAEEMMGLAIQNRGHSFEWVHTRANGEDFWSEIVLTPISLADRDIIHVGWRDLTAKKEAEKDIQEKQALLIQQARFASMGEMISNIAHQWRQPLNALSLIIQKNEFLYQLGKLENENVEKSMKKSMTLIQGMSNTIDDFRDFLSPNKEKHNFLLSDAINHAYYIIEGSLFQNSIEYKLEMSDENIKLYGYQNEISQVIVNLLSNAKEALVENRTSSPHILVKIKQEKKLITIDVIDNGGGVPKIALKQIFDPYFSTKSQSDGRGLGLYMSKMIIEDKMQGKFSVLNTQDGACFTIAFQE